MVGTSCMVLFCKNRGSIPGVHYFCLSASRHDSWLRALGRDPNIERVSHENRVCSQHFAEEDIIYKKNRVTARPGAIPVKNLGIRRNFIPLQDSSASTSTVHLHSSLQEDLTTELSTPNVQNSIEETSLDNETYQEPSDRYEDHIPAPHEVLIKIEPNETLNDFEEIQHVTIKNEMPDMKEDLEGKDTSISQDRVYQDNLVKCQSCTSNKNDHCMDNIVEETSLKRLNLQHKNLEESKPGLLNFDQCEYQTHCGDNINTHSLSHKEVGIFNYQNCDFNTICEWSLKGLHNNSDGVRLLKCNKCDYQSTHKYNMKVHLLRHNSPEEDLKFKCDQCPYKTNFKQNLNRHLLRHKNPEKLEMFKCNNCDFQTKYRSSLITHSLSHKNPEEVELFKCVNCDYQTKSKKNIKAHLLRHNSPEDSKFKCDQCSYKTNVKNCLNRHLLRHRNPEKVEMLKCNNCDFQTRYRNSLITHLRGHKNLEEAKYFQCTQCSYKTIFKRYLNPHMLQHKNPKEIKMFKCDKCDYQTKRNKNLKAHLLRHNSSVNNEILIKKANRARVANPNS